MNDIYKAPDTSLSVKTENNSGQGKTDKLPEGVKGWSWGAFLRCDESIKRWSEIKKFFQG